MVTSLPPNHRMHRMVEYMTNCMAGMFKTARRKAFSAVNRRL